MDSRLASPRCRDARLALPFSSLVRHFDAIWDERGRPSFRQYPLFSLLLRFNRPPPEPRRTPRPVLFLPFFLIGIYRTVLFPFISRGCVEDPGCLEYVATRRYSILFLRLGVDFSSNGAAPLTATVYVDRLGDSWRTGW